MSIASPRPSAVSSVGHLAEIDDCRFRNHAKFQKRSSVFESRSPRFKERRSQAPGPTTYTIPTKPGRRTRSAVLGTQSRLPEAKKPLSDAMYAVDGDWTAANGPSCGFNSGTSRNSRIRNDTPDPCAYHSNQSETKLLKQNAGSMSVFRSRSPRMSINKVTASPHLPLTYAVSKGGAAGTKNSYESTFRSKSPRLPTTSSSNPPPGAHEVGSTFDAAGVKRAAGSTQFLSKTPRIVVRPSDTPDPGAYDPEKPRKSSGFTISATARDKHSGARGPGPTSYSVPPSSFGSKGSASSVFVSGSARFKESKPRTDVMHDLVDVGTEKGRFVSRAPRLSHRISDTPGPGSYCVKEELKKGTTFARSRGSSARSHTPGPGAYQLSSGARASSSIKNGASAAFRSRSARSCNASTREFIPGPGEHQHLDFSAQKKARGIPFAFMTEQRFKSNPSDTPGPGACLAAYSSFLD
eukprot:TRINITY_DN19747_c0_g1_i1.p1 TRINITY_DN19747_c0_g1~~TRINITY_DN19747_c0_g1_i1.p1  ORF type:complete len:465 (+),score=58.16 TRINITY_DN19747_c0_g1_i1:45-1439(+)